MDIAQLEAVAAVDDHGSFSAAAAALHLTQPALSRRIATLERELGLLVFERVGRGVHLTAAGEAVAESARRILVERRRARAEVDAIAGLSHGRIDIAGLPSMLATHLVPVIGAFREAHPRVEMTLSGAVDTADLVDRVASVRCDVGIADVPLHHRGLRTVPLGEQELMAVFPPGTRLVAAGPGELPEVTVTDLRTRPLIVLPEATSTRTLVDELFAGSDDAPAVAITTDLRDLLVPLVLTGAGVALVPDRVADQAARQGAVVARVRPRIRRGIGLVLRDGPASPAAAAFVELARAMSTDA